MSEKLCISLIIHTQCKVIKKGSIKIVTVIPPGPNPPEIIYVQIEIPVGSKVKYEFNKEYNTIILKNLITYSTNNK